MQSIGLVFKKEEMTVVSINEGINGIFLEGYRFLPFLDFKEDEKEGAILNNLERFLKVYKSGKYNLHIALPSDNALVKFLHLPLSVEENLRETLGYEMDRHTPFTFDDVYFDYHVVSRSPESNLLYIMLITIKRDVIDYYLNLLKKINLKPRGIEITTSALFNVYKRPKSPSDNLMDIKWLKNKFAWKDQFFNLLKNSRVEKKTKEQTGFSSIDFLVEYLNDSYELNMLNNGCLYYSKIFSSDSQQQPEAHLQEIYNNGMKAVIHLPYHKEKDITYKFILSGKEMEKAYIDYAPENIRNSFSIIQDLPVRIDKKGEESMASVLPLLYVPVGLALKGLTRVPLDINFIPLPLRPKKKRSKKKMLYAAVVILLLCLGASYFINNIIEMNTRDEVLNEQLSDLKIQVRAIRDLESDAERIKQFSEAINKIKNSDVSKLKLLEELTRIIPEDSWLTEFQYQVKEKKIKISGYALSASKLIPILEESNVFENVKFTSPITTDRGIDKERFRLEMTLSKGESKT